MAPLTILVGSYTNVIYTLSFDPTAASLKLIASTEVGHHPSWISTHPSDPSLIFAGLEQPEGKIVAVKYQDKLAAGTKVAEVDSGGKDPCTLLVLEDEVLIGNYSSGVFATLPISTSHPYILSQAPWTFQMPFNQPGPNIDRQTSSHPHQVVLNTLNTTKREILLPDLGTDKTYRITKGDDGKWTISDSVQYESGGGPRHLVVYENTLYTLLELKSKLATHSFPFVSDAYQHNSASTLLGPLPTPNNMLAAEILIPSPNASFSTPYIYISNRNDPSPEGDTIAIFSVGKEPALLAEVRTGLNHVRGMVFGGEDQKYLIVGGVEGGGVKVYERVDGGKGLKQLAAIGEDIVARPTGFAWV
ncbi:Lactonase, 7-bladed beta-propeller-domain-containing protein [Hygrophoropsis aurantiaca]|uniref:Lactonase, 7-bladed beta-propeller-domain-containing protein n=1 Tax=Hygrophoropsis aurantiaca TaxID=72124 RepID=A0ACB8AFK5_9AGAM|nr:Lactonase, 7-bladed beta-propeller-domain-containing protein [Hygrophoropsis aurantiaca]